MRRRSASRLTVSSLTLGSAPFEERVRVAASAGFDGIGLSAEVYKAARRSGLDDAGMQMILDNYGVVVTEAEFLSDWILDVDRAGDVHPKEATVFHIARTFGVDHVNVGLFETAPPELTRRSFAALCRRAGDVRIAFEFMPFGGVPDLPTAWQLVRDADRSNAGLVIDVWHWVRAATNPRDLIPAGDRVFVVQLCDVGRQALPNMRYESLHHRLAPGDGDGHANVVVSLLVERGVDAEVSVEVMSDALLEMGLSAAAETVMTAARDVLTAGGWFVPGPGE